MAPRSIYSVRLFTGPVGPGDSLLYAVPDGFVAVVRDVDVVNYAAAPSTNLQLYTGSSGADIWFISHPAENTYWPWRGRQVFPAGDELRIYNGTGESVDVTVSGYLLAE